MVGVVGEASSKNLYIAATTGDVNTIRELLQQDPFLLDLVSFPCSRNLLHIATMKAQPGIVEEVLRINPQLARDSDSQKWSPLHIAAAGGHVEIASKLLRCAPKMLWAHDDQGMNPIHVAAMNGHLEMLRMLVEFDPAPAKERVYRGQTTLHLCVKHEQLEALKVLVENVAELALAKDDDGETLLHFAVRYKRVEIMKYLDERNKIDKSRNSKGETALKVLHESFPDETSTDVRDIKETLSNGAAFNASHEYLSKMSDLTMVVVVLIATMAYQSAASPPGGVWQQDSLPHIRAGEAVIASRHPKLYKQFLGANTTAFVSSLISIFLLNTGLPSMSATFLFMVMYSVWVSLASIAVSYGASLTVITPHMEPQSLDKVIYIVVGVPFVIYVLLFLVLVFGPLIRKRCMALLQLPKYEGREPNRMYFMGEVMMDKIQQLIRKAPYSGMYL